MLPAWHEAQISVASPPTAHGAQAHACPAVQPLQAAVPCPLAAQTFIVVSNRHQLHPPNAFPSLIGNQRQPEHILHGNMTQAALRHCQRRCSGADLHLLLHEKAFQLIQRRLGDVFKVMELVHCLICLCKGPALVLVAS